MTANDLGTVTLDWRDANALRDLASMRRYQVADRAAEARRHAEADPDRADWWTKYLTADEAEIARLEQLIARVDKALR